MTINERLKILRKDKGLTLKQFGKAIGITDASVSQMETGKIGMSNQTVLSICRVFGVREDWLRAGKGEMYVNTASKQLEDIYLRHNLTSQEKILIEEFVALSPEVRRGILEYVVRVADKLRQGGDLQVENEAAEIAWQIHEEKEHADDSFASLDTASGTKMA